MPVDATVETFGELTGKGSVLVDFWGPRCQPCLAMMPTVAQLEEEAAGAVKVVKVNAPEAREICRELKVIALGERDGVPGPAIAECVRTAGAEVIFVETECFV